MTLWKTNVSLNYTKVDNHKKKGSETSSRIFSYKSIQLYHGWCGYLSLIKIYYHAYAWVYYSKVLVEQTVTKLLLILLQILTSMLYTNFLKENKKIKELPPTHTMILKPFGIYLLQQQSHLPGQEASPVNLKSKSTSR